MTHTEALSDAVANDEVNPTENFFRLVLLFPVVLFRILFFEFIIVVLIIVGNCCGCSPCGESDFRGLQNTLRCDLPSFLHGLRFLLRAIFITVLVGG